jgi:hypothetical protein
MTEAYRCQIVPFHSARFELVGSIGASASGSRPGQDRTAGTCWYRTRTRIQREYFVYEVYRLASGWRRKELRKNHRKVVHVEEKGECKCELEYSL